MLARTRGSNLLWDGHAALGIDNNVKVDSDKADVIWSRSLEECVVVVRVVLHCQWPAAAVRLTPFSLTTPESDKVRRAASDLSGKDFCSSRMALLQRLL